MTVSADSSFVVSYYIADAHSAETDRRMDQRPSVWITRLNRSELAHAIHQYLFRGLLTASAAQLAWRDFEHDCVRGIWIQTVLPESIWEISIDLARRHGPTIGVRTLDSLHVACALELGAERFWTFDARQERLAQEVGLNTGP